jgi:bis(5'-nucleosidyl)-tetraphosphatase
MLLENIKEGYDFERSLIDKLNQIKPEFIKSVYVYEFLQPNKDTDNKIKITIITTKKELTPEEQKILAEIKENNLKIIEVEFKEYSFSEMIDPNVEDDASLLKLYDFLINAYVIYGERIENTLSNYLKEKNFEKTREETIIVGQGAGVILYNTKINKILILEHSYGGGGYWAFPKGGIEENETHEDTINREVDEETGITNINIKEYLYQTNHHYKNKNVIRKTKVYFYFATTEETDVKVSDEHLNYKWVDLEEVKNYVTYNNSLYVLSLVKI